MKHEGWVDFCLFCSRKTAFGRSGAWLQPNISKASREMGEVSGSAFGQPGICVAVYYSANRRATDGQHFDGHVMEALFRSEHLKPRRPALRAVMSVGSRLARTGSQFPNNKLMITTIRSTRQ